MYYFIVNTTSRSGKGAKLWKSIKYKLQEKNIVYKAFKTKYAGHATELAGQICQARDLDKHLIIVGGDGTINEVINGITDFTAVKVGIIPTGSGNDFAKGHGISLKAAPEEVLEDILRENPTERPVDIGKVWWGEEWQSRLFAISSGVGLDAIVCKKTLTSKVKPFLNKLKLGSLTYSVLTVTSLLTMTKFCINVTTDELSESRDKIIYSALLLGAYEGGGVKMAPNAVCDDGKFDVCTAGRISKLRAFTCFPLLIKGKHTKLKAFKMETTSSYVIETDRPVALHTDGEFLGDITKARFECLKGALKLINSEE